ncbi:hypothetical protein Tco_0431086 [Tanacetum coccineum]
MATAIALGIYLAYFPYEEGFQYLAMVLAVLVTGHYHLLWRGFCVDRTRYYGLGEGSAPSGLICSLQLKALVITFSSLGDGFHTYDGITNTKFYGIVSMLNR